MLSSFLRIGMVLALATVAGAQDLTVVGGQGAGIHVTAADMMKMARTMITVTEHGKQRKYEGVLLRDLLTLAGAPMGDKLKGQNMPAFVYLTAHDGYHVVLALAEVEPSVQDNQILVADQSGGSPLSRRTGLIPPHCSGRSEARAVDPNAGEN